MERNKHVNMLETVKETLKVTVKEHEKTVLMEQQKSLHEKNVLTDRHAAQLKEQSVAQENKIQNKILFYASKFQNLTNEI